ncbi:ATP-binding protein [Actinomadura viridis]|uniref:Tetratricopeptide (TPR) repeat protein n=1 Tax=Actinomadura viridis TaxID=58110 RepID=A0A931GP42_9ACTN|nr:tetratricopeptide repeat protein [Actinomadura viridis]MBG6093560.1 tetratricopeptide (TPR) repeat protein [Actinomadura viridis]
MSDAVAGEGSPAVFVISGVGGVGKTSLGLAWLHRIRDRFGDGQFYADLRGFSGAEPVLPSELLARFLRALGVAAEAVPADIDEQGALFRSLTAGRRLIIMLDNAVSAAQVRPLLPGHGPSLVVVTSRRRLTGLAVDGASFLTLGPLEQSAAVDLLDRMLGSARTGAEPRAARSLAELCGRLPLALCTSAARLSTRENWPISRVVDELADERGRLAALGSRGEDDDGESSVRSVFEVTYRHLPADPARLYRLLSVHPGADFDLRAAAAVIEAEQEPTARGLDALADANLIEEEPEGRYRFHDLTRLHARAVAEEEEPEAERERAFERLLEHSLTIAVAADRVIIPGRWHLGRHYERDPVVVFADNVKALEWLESELPNCADLITAAHERGLHRGTWELCEALWGLFIHRKHYATWMRTHEIGVAAAAAAGDPRAEARMLVALAYAHLNRRDFPEAERRAERALELEVGGGHARGVAAALECLGVARLGLDDVPGAIASFSRALSVQRDIGLERGVAMMHRRLGEAMARLDRADEAIDHLNEALAYFDGQDDHYNRARTLIGLAGVLTARGRLGEAAATLTTASKAADHAGARHEQGNVQLALADLARRAGDPGAERARLERAAAVFGELGAPQAIDVHARLARLDRSPGLGDHG